MDIRTFDYFIALEETGVYAQAAKRLFITPQGLSASIRRLEGELGVPLFNSSGGFIVPTEYGRVFSEYARSISHNAAKMKCTIDEMSRRGAGEIRLVSSTGLINCFPDDFLGSFNADNRHSASVTLMKVVSDDDCESALESGYCDFALINDPIDHARFSSVPLHRDFMFAWIRAGHPLAEKASIRLSDLSGQRIVHVTRVYKQSRTTELLLEERADAYDILHEDEMIQVLDHVITEGRVGLTVRIHAETIVLPNVSAVPIEDDTWGFSLCCRPDRILSEADAALVDAFKEHASFHV